MHRIILTLIASCAGLCAAAGLTRADCVSECQASTYCDAEMNASGECAQRLNDCYINQCNRRTYGAIAYGSKSGAAGWAYDFDDAPSAEKEALKNCGALPQRWHRRSVIEAQTTAVSGVMPSPGSGWLTAASPWST